MDAIDCSLRLGFPCEMEAKLGNFSVAVFKELVNQVKNACNLL